jgi:lysophospholipase L1-like esterase
MAPLMHRIACCLFYHCSSRTFSWSGLAQGGDLCARFMLTFLALSFAAAGAGQAAHWVVSWGASPSPPPDAAQIRTRGLEFKNQTLREIVHLSIGGSTVRVRFSNHFGRQSLEIGSAHLALRTSDSTILPPSDRALTFGGAPGVTVPPNAFVLSDPVSLAVPAESDLAISIFLPHVATAAGIHYLAQQTSYVGAGDQTAAPSIANPRAITSWIFLAGVDVSAPLSAAAIAVFGDSRVDGDGSTPNANRRWPNVLGKRLSRQGLPLGVLNAGIIGNRILQDAPQAAAELGVNGLARFDRDALDQPGVKYVIVLEGIVDIGLPGTRFAPVSEAPSVDGLVTSMRQVIARAHDRGMKIFGATQTPFSGATMIPDMFSAKKEIQRKALNQWIRSSHAFDAVIDFEKVVLDPANPEKILPAFDSGDHIHPNDAGYEAMANSIDISLFQPGVSNQTKQR